VHAKVEDLFCTLESRGRSFANIQRVFQRYFKLEEKNIRIKIEIAR